MKQLISVVLLAVFVPTVAAGPRTFQRGYFPSGSRGGGSWGSGGCATVVVPAATVPAVQSAQQVVPIQVSGPADPFEAVNALRAARGLRPYLKDPYLTQAAVACARHRAANKIAGHVDDFSFAAGVSYYPPVATGCACWQPGTGFGSCCIYDGYTYCGAATVIGVDGMAYHSLFVR